MAFVDGDNAISEPQDLLFCPNVQIIVATSPKGAHQPWIKQTEATRYSDFIILATSLWSFAEVFLAGLVSAFLASKPRLIHFFRTFLYPLDVPSTLLKESISYFGNDPRRCFYASSSMFQLKIKKKEVLALIEEVGGDHKHILKALETCRNGADAVSHQIFQVYPNPMDGSQQFDSCHRKPVSRWVFTSLLNHCETNEAEAAALLYKQLSGISSAGAVWGLLYERLVLDYLDRIEEERKLPIRPLTRKDDDTTWTYRGRTERLNFRDEDVPNYINNAVENNRSLHLVPLISNYPGVNSIVYCPTDVLTCIQVAINSEHKIAVTGLERIQNKLLERTADLPKKTRPWRFIFIVPRKMEDSFRLQKFDGDTELGEWAGKVNQYVCGLDV